MNKKKIMLVTDVYGWGGHTRANYIMKHLSDEFYFKLKDAKEFNYWEMRTNKNFFNNKNFQDYKRNHTVRVNGGEEFYNFDNMKKWVRKNGIPDRSFDLIYFLFHTMMQKKSVKRMINSSIKMVTTVTGYPVIKDIFYNGFKKNELKIAKNNFLNIANKFDAVCSNNIKSLNNLKEIYNGKTSYLPRGVDPEIFYPERNEFNDDEEFTAIYVGKPVLEKGLKHFIRPACVEAGIKLLVNDRNYENALPPDQMRKFYNKGHVYIVSSTIDGTPNPALEAAACGLPIISNEIGNMPEFIKDGVNGFLIERDVNEYVNKLKWMKNNRKQTYEMGQKAKEEILANWTWEIVTRNERNLFRELLK